MKTTIKVLSFAAILAVAAAPAAFADTVQATNSTLATNPGVYYGSTTGNSGWTTITVTGKDPGLDHTTVQLGLEAITRFVGPITPSSNDYTYQPGPSALDPGHPDLASWDFAFSINTGSDPMSDFTYSISITDDVTHASTSFDPTTKLTDNALAVWNGSSSTVQCHGNGAPNCTYDGTQDGMQNAENLDFSFIGSVIGFSNLSLDGYTISLKATPIIGLTDFQDPTVSIDVVPPAVAATPEPSSLALLGTGLMTVVGVARRKFKA